MLMMVWRRTKTKKTVAGDGCCVVAGRQQEFVEEAYWVEVRGR